MKNKLYRENRHIIEKMATAIAVKTHMDREELECQGNLIFCEVAERYNPSIGDFSKYLSTTLHFELYKYVKRWRMGGEPTEYIGELIDSKDAHFDKNIPDVTFENMSRDAKLVVDTVLYRGTNFSGTDKKAEKINKRRIFKHLKEDRGWNYSRILKTFDEISTSLQV